MPVASVITFPDRRLLAIFDSETNGFMVRMMDDFCRANLPVIEDFPQFIFGVPQLRFPRSLNCAAALLDEPVDGHHWGDRVAIRTESRVTWTYQALCDASNRIANMLVRDGGLVPGNRVLLHGINHSILAAWLGVIKAGGVTVATMPLLRAGELSVVIDRPKVSRVPCEAALSSELARALGAQQGVGYVRVYETDGPGLPERWERDQYASLAIETIRACDPRAIAFTSGTTGQRKAAVHFHRDVIAVCRCFPEHMLEPTEDNCLCWLVVARVHLRPWRIVVVSGRRGRQRRIAARDDPVAVAVRGRCVSGPHSVQRADGRSRDAARPRRIRRVEPAQVRVRRRGASVGRDAWQQRTGIHLIDGTGSIEMLHICVSIHDGPPKEGRSARRCPAIASLFWTTRADACRLTRFAISPCWGPPGVVT
ncbi:2-aminobenzoate-CoA ligase [Burkholderia pyrrocinia]|uniref:2-aminobenzoate-CoA ligase n=1 Tax=Burkholderia pyrrocinia TaxID=60550 RepID=A0A318HU21_BURPY|nr:2-aminobenzoate-CoA ligase [Burkholderia pyrrocinia]SFW90279.1 2-aminobenzoate-CoA ligase [Burkholderia sp. NFACC33-1]SFY46436.1 2-aminobenzoate-CoA ligase [Burkholderia sp. NFPP32]